MTLQTGKRYKLRFNVNDTELVFTALIVSIDENFVTFIDRYNHTIGYNLKTLISYEEVQNDM